MAQTRRDFLKIFGLGSAALLSNPIEVLATKAKSSAPQLGLAEYINLADIYRQTTPLVIPDPETPCSIGGEDAPIHLYWNDKAPTRANGQPLCAEDLIIDNQKGQLRVKEENNSQRILLQWKVPKTRAEREKNNPKDNWLRDETGPHIVISLQSHEAPVETLHYAPLSIAASRAHPLHYQHIYVTDKDFQKQRPQNDKDKNKVCAISELEAILPKPAHGRYHKLSPKPFVNKNSVAWALWCDDTAHKMAYNLLHFSPHIKGYKKEHNLSLLALAMTESSGGEILDKIGPNPFLKNKWGYGGLFQFYVGEQPSLREALQEAEFATKQGNWKNIQVGEDSISSSEAFLKNWEAQCYAQLKWMEKLQSNIGPTYYANQEKPHVKNHPHSLFGYCAAAHLTGPSSSKILLNTGKSKKDGTGTPNSYYAHKFGLIPDHYFFQGKVEIPDKINTITSHVKSEFEDDLDMEKTFHEQINKIQAKQFKPMDRSPAIDSRHIEWTKKQLKTHVQETMRGH